MPQQASRSQSEHIVQIGNFNLQTLQNYYFLRCKTADLSGYQIIIPSNKPITFSEILS